MLSLSSVYSGGPTGLAFTLHSGKKFNKSPALNALFFHSVTSNYPNKLQKNRPFSVKRNESVRVKIGDAISLLYPSHPFATGITHSNVQKVMSKYLAMSQAFPLIQSGAYHSLIKKSIAENKEIPEEFFKAFAVAMFLCNDEMGSHHILTNGGNRRLPEILKTEEQSHASMLKKDLQLLFGQPSAPDFCPITSKYLLKLGESLGATDIVDLVASMVAFENHADHMINAVWSRLEELFPSVDKESLEYFKIHVGGDDPGEAYHVAMTDQLIVETKANAKGDEFISKVLKYYSLSANWCRDIC